MNSVVSLKTDNDCWYNKVIEEPPSLIKDRLAQVFAWVLFAEANSLKKTISGRSECLERFPVIPYLQMAKAVVFFL